ncbi:hypothetical protein PENARI_c005G06193 [Penicillium arizonense]|uniref:Uncharacterized protein n=1 Tax=Penicillium arizonense TaxID=1835702 RepID=A0A1F5LPD6_PENAI|nr:hypothetical protein PENARI_c005G06193 [Penicillium arizonense]OGE55082.1 hypothetical protein PENARI_c005G06193 [Penicillium arizonense]
MATLVVACPCAISLSQPAAVMIASGTSAARGIVLKRGALTLRMLSSATTVIFDKTGTLTSGKISVYRFEMSGDISQERWWEIIALAEEKAPSHWARSILLDYSDARVPGKCKVGLQVLNYENLSGPGIGSVIGPHSVCMGNAAMLRECGIHDSERKMEADLAAMGASEMCVLLALDGDYAGYITFRA